MLFGGFRPNLDDFWCRGDRPEISCFLMAAREAPRLRHHGELMVILALTGPIAVTRQYRGAPQHAKYNIKHAGIKRYDKTRRQVANIGKIKAVI